MKIQIISNPLLMRDGNNFRIELTTRVLPSKAVEVKNAEEADTAIAAYAAEVEATGKPALIGVIPAAIPGRKFPGFDAYVKSKRVFVNEQAIADAAA